VSGGCGGAEDMRCGGRGRGGRGGACEVWADNLYLIGAKRYVMGKYRWCG